MNATRPRRVGCVLAGLLFAAPVLAAEAQPVFESLPHVERAGPAPVRAPLPVEILIEAPGADEVVRNDLHQAPLRGVAIAQSAPPRDVDVMLVIDISGSTKKASGADVDGDGHWGVVPSSAGIAPGLLPDDVLSTDPDDTILAAEIRAADALLATLPANGRIRVGVISFSGEMNPETGKRRRWNQQDAWLEVPLTTDFAAVRAHLPEILRRGPYGGTNFAAGLRLAITELVGLSGARSGQRPHAARLVLFLTDGVPTFPVGLGSESDPGDVQAALAAAELAARAQVRVDTYALGPTALTNPHAATEISRLTGGTFLAVQKPGDIVSFLRGASFANVDDVVFTNLTTREVSTDVELLPDGSFSGFVPVREGGNRVRVTALSSDGSSASIEVDLDYESTAGEGQLALEIERIRTRNKELMLLMDRKKIRRFRELQQKRLEFETVELPDGGAGDPNRAGGAAPDRDGDADGR